MEARPRPSLIAVHTAPEAGRQIPPTALRIDRRETGQAVRGLQIVLDLEPDLEAISIEPCGLTEIPALQRLIAEAVESCGEAPDGEPQRAIRPAA